MQDISQETAVAAEHAPPAPGWPADLTKREVQIATMLATGASRQEIAVALDLSDRTVDTHRLHIMEKTGARNAVILARMAIRAGIVPMDQSADAAGPVEG